MKTLLLSVSVSLLVHSMAVCAKDVRDWQGEQKPMLLCYAAVPKPTHLIQEGYSQTLRDVESATVESHAAPDQVISVPAMNKGSELTAPAVSEPTFASRGIFLQRTASAAIERRGRARFCMGNLMEGSLYDFKKKNDLHFEIAGPGVPCKENCSLLRYESFSVSFLVRFKM